MHNASKNVRVEIGYGQIESDFDNLAKSKRFYDRGGGIISSCIPCLNDPQVGHEPRNHID